MQSLRPLSNKESCQTASPLFSPPQIQASNRLARIENVSRDRTPGTSSAATGNGGSFGQAASGWLFWLNRMTGKKNPRRKKKETTPLQKHFPLTRQSSLQSQQPPQRHSLRFNPPLQPEQYRDLPSNGNFSIPFRPNWPSNPHSLARSLCSLLSRQPCCALRQPTSCGAPFRGRPAVP